jgi:hypothetical protein
MWAVLDYNNEKVIGVIPPDQNIMHPEAKKEINGRTIILMTLENSPAGIGWTYEDGKFYPPKGNE